MKAEVLTFGSHAGFWLHGELIIGGSAEQGLDSETIETIAHNTATTLGVGMSVKEIEPPEEWQWDELSAFLDA